MTLLSDEVKDGTQSDTTSATTENICELQSSTSDDDDLDDQMKCNVIPFGLQQRAGYVHGKAYSDLMGGKCCY